MEQLDEPETDNGLLLAKQLSQGNEFVYCFVQVNYKEKIDPTVLNSIRLKLKQRAKIPENYILRRLIFYS